MAKYTIKRLIMALITIFVVATLTFFVMYLVPGGPFVSEKAVSEQAQEAMNEKYGLDQPVPVQYKNYMLRLVQGDLGVSVKQRGRTINQIIFSKFPVSATLGGLSVLVALLIGIPLGCIAAYKRNKILDKIIIVFSTLGIAVPSFVLCAILMMIFGVQLKILPTYGLNSPASYIMPIMALSTYPTAYISRLVRSSMLDVLGQDYMRTARAKGVSQKMQIFKHALRNAVLPVITYVGPLTAYTLTGSLVVENIFTIPGLGSEFVKAITSRDYPLIMGTTIFLATILILMNVLVDILYKVIDPRIELE